MLSLIVLLCLGISLASSRTTCASSVSGMNCNDEIESTGSALLQKKFTQRMADKGSVDRPEDLFIERPTEEESLVVPLQKYIDEVGLLADKPILQFNPPTGFKTSYLHTIVGQDGVKVITLDRTPERFTNSAIELAKGGIIVTSFPASDSATASHKELHKACDRGSNLNCAKADSHRRALVAASLRKNDWTLILEDDMALLDAEKFDKQFKSAWEVLQKTSPETQIIRLAWCLITPQDHDYSMVFQSTEDVEIKKWHSKDNVTYNSGCCIGAYMVHRKIIPEILDLFPCAAGIADICYKRIFQARESEGEDEAGHYRTRGMRVLASIEAPNSRARIESITQESWLGQHGIMYQDRRKLSHVTDPSGMADPGREAYFWTKLDD